MSDHVFKPETLAIHAGQIPDAATGARALPIYQTTSFVFDSADHAASLFNLQTFGNVYSRLSNPTVAALEERVAALEGGRAAVASASGMAAEAMALMTMLQAGDHVVAAGALYGGTVTMLAVNLKKFGIATTFVDATDIDALAAAMQPNTRAVFAESLGNPSLVVLDIAAAPRQRMRTACRCWSTTPCRAPSCATRWRSARTSSCTRPPSTWPAMAPRSAAWSSRAAASPGTTASSRA
jgi:O-acetylhomoserine (thiol)-lyase